MIPSLASNRHYRASIPTVRTLSLSLSLLTKKLTKLLTTPSNETPVVSSPPALKIAAYTRNDKLNCFETELLSRDTTPVARTPSLSAP